MNKMQLFEEYKNDINRFESLVESNVDESISTLFPYIFKHADNLSNVYSIYANSDTIRELANSIFKGITQEFMDSYKDLTYRYFKAIDGMEDFEQEKQITDAYMQQLQDLLNKKLKIIITNKFEQFGNELSMQCNRQSYPDLNVFKNHLLNGIQNELGNIHVEIKNYIYNRTMDKCMDYIITKESITKQDGNNADYNEISEFIELVQNKYMGKVPEQSLFKQHFDTYCKQAELLTSSSLTQEQINLLMRDMKIKKDNLLQQIKLMEIGQENTENFDSFEVINNQKESEDLDKSFK